MNQQLTELQILSLIRRQENCDQVINELLRVLHEKIRTVNQIISSNLVLNKIDYLT